MDTPIDFRSKDIHLVDSVRKVLEEIFPPHVWDDSPHDTASRVVRFWQEFARKGPPPVLTTFEPDGGQAGQMVCVKDIEFASLCSHHLLPFWGNAHVAYIPHEKMIGISKIPRLVDFFARQPQMQETLTDRIGSTLKSIVQAKGVAVVIEARHTCMACRGVRKHNAAMVTSYIRGVFLSSPPARDEFMALIQRNRL